MRDARYRFSDDVRSMTRAIAVRMIHAGEVAESPEALDAWIARTDDLRDRLVKGGYGSAFSADDLFPLFQAHVARAAPSTPARSRAGATRWLWIGLIAAVVVIAGLILAMM